MAAPMNNLFVREIQRKGGDSLKINQSEVGDVGCVVWDAALVLTSYLETQDFQNGRGGENALKNKNILELGSGTGVVGIQAACCGANAVITDLEEFIPLMELNIEVNKSCISGKIQAKTLNWGQDCAAFGVVDYLLLADCIYYEASLEPLVKSINDLSGENTQVLCCYEERTTGNKPMLQRQFFKLVSETFQVDEIPLERQDEFFRSEDIHIMKFTKKGKLKMDYNT